MKSTIYTLLTLLLVVLITSSCRKDFDTIASNGSLKFSKDTVFINRVFDNISSSTHRFTVKNTSNNDITIPTINLERGDASFYRLNVDGNAGKSFNDVSILAKDSIFVFVEATVDFNALPAGEIMYRDKVLFDVGTNEQKVELEAQVLDVHLIRPSRTALAEGGFDYEEVILGQDGEGNDVGVQGLNLTGNTTWSNDKPYLVYGYVGVPSGATLTIEAGTRVHFHSNSGIIVQENGKLVIQGELSTTEDLENEVILQGDRLEDFYTHVAGQWGTIWFLNGSQGSTINHATIKNATIGLLVDSDNTTETIGIKNTQIYNTTSYGILGRNAQITGKNVVIGNNGLASFSSILGGSYDFYQSTFANYWRSSSRQEPTILLRNISDTFVAPLQANFTNCIIDGSQQMELGFDMDNGAAFNFQFKDSMLKFDDTSNTTQNDPLFDFSNTTLYNSIYRNQDADFKNTNVFDGPMDLRISNASFAVGKANLSVINADIDLQTDILGVDRTSTPDLGAYTNIVFEED